MGGPAALHRWQAAALPGGARQGVARGFRAPKQGGSVRTGIRVAPVAENLVLTPPFALCSRGVPAQPGRWPAGRSARPYALKPGGIGAAEHAHPGCPRYQATSARAHMPDRVAAADSKFLSGGAMGVLFSLTGATADGRQRRGLGEDNLRCSQLVCCVTRPHPTPSTLHLLGTCGGRRGHCTPLSAPWALFLVMAVIIYTQAPLAPLTRC